ncbi:hemolysin family protein [Actinomycetospora cinnamomea]|uniref:CBS domain containing-hemolysin-like protein n=1 Tax=Actinomycetospora cinnamomea TaxID=663609 RepID=A0A2U1FM73_9PSEU|nr:hemolysin family protein [Actinomycetospora cinnamomea]PVZ13267.1 CBS domain containing-hemolysin-like protein [Actinomycetospora cinnamomea]
MSIEPAIAAAIVLLALNAFFVGAEFALISARRASLEPRAATSRAARITVRAMENVSLMMAGAQLGITICSLGLGALGEPAVAAAIEPAFTALGLPEAAVHPVAFAIALMIVVYLHVTVGEMVPKNIALAVPDRAALVLAPPLVAVVTVLRPFLWVLNGLANLTLRAMRVEPRDEIASAFSRDEVAGLVEQSRAHGLLDRDEAALVHGALGFSEATLASVAVDDVVTARPGATVAELEALAHEHGFSRLPLRDERGWHGYVHVKDLLAPPAPPRDRPVPARLVRRLATLSPDTTLAEALSGMRRSGAHLALVADPGADPDRVVALDDVLAALVGEIHHAGTGS